MDVCVLGFSSWGSVKCQMGIYEDDGRGSAFCTHMKLFHLGLEQWLPGEVTWHHTCHMSAYHLPDKTCQGQRVSLHCAFVQDWSEYLMHAYCPCLLHVCFLLEAILAAQGFNPRDFLFGKDDTYGSICKMAGRWSILRTLRNNWLGYFWFLMYFGTNHSANFTAWQYGSVQWLFSSLFQWWH